MNITRTVALLMLSLPAAAAAQTIFHDDFSGKALGPHWQVGAPELWNHRVENGLLTVDWIEPPGIGQANVGWLRTAFAEHTGDFVMTVRAGWEPGEHRAFLIQLGTAGPSPRLVGSINYGEPEGMAPTLELRAIGQPQTVPAPGPGMHEFAFVRTGSEANFFLNQQHIATLPTSELPVGGLGFFFTLGSPGQHFSEMYVDFVTIVPAPAAFWVLIAAAGAACRRRRE